MIRKTLFYLIFISTLAFFYITCSDEANAQTYQGKVVKVADGDSITILHEGKELCIRLADIDAPERGQPFWRKSKEALAYYVAGKEVEVIEVDIDRYKRVVGQVYARCLWVNGELVRGGFAYVYPEYATSKHLYEYEHQAKESQMGIWKLPEKERVKPWEWRKKKVNLTLLNYNELSGNYTTDFAIVFAMSLRLAPKAISDFI